MAFVSLGGRRDDGFGEPLILMHTFRQFHATEFAASILVSAPCRACKDRTDDHLHPETFAFQSHGDHRIGCCQFPVRADVCCLIKELRRDLIQYLPLERNTFGQDHVKCRDTVSCDHNDEVIVDVVNVAHLTMVNALLSFEMEIGMS